MATYDMFGNVVDDEPYGHTGPPEIPNGVPAPSNPPGAMNPADYITPVPGTNPNTGGTGGNATPSPNPNAFDPSKVPSGIDPAWAQDFIARNPGDYSRIASAYGSPRTGESGGTPTSPPKTTQGPTTTTTTTPPSGPNFVNTNPQFASPTSNLIENYALDQFKRLQNPDPNSGTAMLEQYAKELVETLKQPVYSPEQEAVIKGRAIDAIEQERTATKQRWVEEMSRRGITPKSGVYLDGLQKIDEHFGSARVVFEREFAAAAIQKTKDQRFQVLNTLGQLSGSEEGRLANALTYATVPKQLEDNAFQQGIQLMGASGNPSSMLQSALTMVNSINANNQMNAQNRAYANGQIGNMLGQLIAAFSGGG